MSVSLYAEGGGDSKALKSACRQGFAKFISKAGPVETMPKIIACGSRGDAYRSFTRAQASGQPAMLLVDAEDPVKSVGPWEHLKDSDNWDRPLGATDDQCHLMVQVMESWFLADVDALDSFYGQGFRSGSLPANQNIEQISKQDVLGGLVQATARSRKGAYRKASHSYDILGRLDPGKVRAASPYAARFIEAL